MSYNETPLQYRRLLGHELTVVQDLMLAECSSIPLPLRDAVEALVMGGGKRLRPAIVLLFAHMCEADPDKALTTAAGVEMLHTATLVHDDLIDHARTRRGIETLNAHWSTPATVLTGDIVFALAAKLIARSENPLLVQRFAETLEVICTGELEQLFGRHQGLPTLETYYARVFAKTGSLFALCAQSGPILAGCADQLVEQAYRFGALLGQAFQIADDVLDFVGDPRTMGKPIGSDLREGIVTLPVMEYINSHPGDDRVRVIFESHSDESTIHALVEAIRASHAPERAMARARAHAEEALTLIQRYPESPQRAAVAEIVNFAVHRHV